MSSSFKRVLAIMAYLAPISLFVDIIDIIHHQLIFWTATKEIAFANENAKWSAAVLTRFGLLLSVNSEGIATVYSFHSANYAMRSTF
jgi:hypothetical protein